MCGFYYKSGKRIIKQTWGKRDYWFAIEVMNMADEQSKNNDIKLIKRRVQTISKD